MVNFLKVQTCSTLINKNFVKTPGLIHYWPFFMNTHDIVGEADLYGGVNADLTTDRFNKTNSAISLTNGYYKLPPRVYFNSSYSFLAWVKLKQITNWARILEVSNGAPNDNVIFGFNKEMTDGISNVVYDGPTLNSILDAASSTILTLNKWQHVAFVLNFPNFYLYLDGQQVYTTTAINVPNNVIRTVNYVGRSVFYEYQLGLDPDANADLDELKIFNRGLSQSELLFEMNNSIVL